METFETSFQKLALTKPEPFEAGRFRGLAVRFDTPIETVPLRTKIRRGAFERTIRERGRRIKILLEHNQSQIMIGVPIRLEETAEGLFVEASLNKSKAGLEAADMLRHLKSLDKLDAAELSIGFDPMRISFEKDDASEEEFRIVEEARLWEISLVNIGADQTTEITEAASLRQAQRELPADTRAVLALDAQRAEEDFALAEAEAFLRDVDRRENERAAFEEQLRRELSDLEQAGIDMFLLTSVLAAREQNQ